MSIGLADQQTDISLQCDHFSDALEFYTDSLHFRLDGIFPADAPRLAILSGHGLTLRLQATAAKDAAATTCETPVKVNKASDKALWGIGRAGMQYRDLVPDRMAGAMIASHIRIPDGGPVPDYVHYHHVQFQLIYCHRGWVRVVYQDQGPPFVMHEGDCVLQAPTIRHQVLECSDAFEVVEIGSPAEHETYVDHDLELPTPVTAVGRLYGGQSFVFNQAADAQWQAWQCEGFDYRETGIAAASAGNGAVVVVRARAAGLLAELTGEGEFQFFFVLAGSVMLESGGDTDELRQNDSFVVRGGTDYRLSASSADLELLLVTMQT
jgi:quercetin dioxygenase-like cupin family protein